METQVATTQVEPAPSGLAIASLVCGIGGFLTGPLTGIPAIVTGHMALSRIKKSGDAIRGKSMAITGLVLGYVTTVLMTILAVLAAIVFTTGLAVSKSVFKSAQKTITLSIATQLETAVNNFFEEYGILPKGGNVDTVVRTDKDRAFFNELLGLNAAGAGSLNPRSVKFLSLREAKYDMNGENGLIYSADGTSAEGLFDKWGGPYHVALDLDSDGKVTVPSQSGAPITLERRAAAWSDGPDRKPGTGDDVTTW